ncbi:FAD-binding oxidoreductase [Shewanella sp. Isolate11]|uniref:NAD(P)/FAD-dependent oxidoreductase n=1 Tax=Shewanella sp. Isolate11 TaxID=2908530 RepID=UPI001EFD4BDE|nr:FAD-binding oxidoreductase [Shewanella sp. Isolate11]MCG9696659.1 FAD-binding oxidoreductase [Shewanella sp. Isolate11]
MHYDPLISSSPSHQAWPNSYWANSVSQPTPLAKLTGRKQFDVAIIGGGYTGILTAYYLATEFEIDCCIIEANQVGFGASGRNAGFVLKGSGRLSYPQMSAKWGLEVTKGIYREYTAAVHRVEHLIKQHHIDCDKQANGYIKVAHNRAAFTKLITAAEYIATHLGDDAQLLSQQDLQQQYMQNHQAFGALRLTEGFGVNPLKLLLGYKAIAMSSGVTLFESSCVQNWQTQPNGHILQTEEGEVFAKQVLCAGNAYTPKQINSLIDNRYLPILSNVIVTEPLTESQLLATGLKTHQVIMDTRLLKYYYRLLPDNRLLFGGRGAITGSEADNPIYAKRLKQALCDCFPILEDCSIEYNWTGWIAAALDDMPHVFSQNGASYSIGYCGSGVAFAAQAAFRLAQRIAGEAVPNLPLYQEAAPKFPYAKYRRLVQSAYYQYAWLKDRYF